MHAWARNKYNNSDFLYIGYLSEFDKKKLNMYGYAKQIYRMGYLLISFFNLFPVFPFRYFKIFKNVLQFEENHLEEMNIEQTLKDIHMNINDKFL